MNLVKGKEALAEQFRALAPSTRVAALYGDRMLKTLQEPNVAMSDLPEETWH